MKTKDLNRLIYNPLWISTLLHYFLSGAAKSTTKQIKFELVYLAVPFLFDERLILKLESRTAKSTFSTLFDTIESKNCLIGMDRKISSFTEVTNNALLILGNKVTIDKGGYIHTSDCLDYRKMEDSLRDCCKAAHNLGLILAKEPYREIFLKIGAAA